MCVASMHAPTTRGVCGRRPPMRRWQVRSTWSTASPRVHRKLNPRGVNAIRRFPGRGVRVWGARTLSSDPLWKYVNVRRLFIFLEASIYNSTQWVVFEPNATESLGAREADRHAVPEDAVAGRCTLRCERREEAFRLALAARR